MKKKLDLLHQQHNVSSVDSGLGVLCQLLDRSVLTFDAHATLAALEQLVDVAREKVDEKANCFGIILRQTRVLLFNGGLLLKLIESTEKVAIAKEIQKALKPCRLFC